MELFQWRSVGGRIFDFVNQVLVVTHLGDRQIELFTLEYIFHVTLLLVVLIVLIFFVYTAFPTIGSDE